MALRRTLDALGEFDQEVRSFIKSQSAGFDHDRSRTVGASEIEKCAKATAYKKAGIEHDEGFVDDPGYAHRGNIIEDHFAAPLAKRWFKNMGAKLLYAGQKAQMSIVAEEAFASATPDGLAINVPKKTLIDLKGGDAFKGGDLLIEFKSIDPMVNVARLPRIWHSGQVNYGIGLMRAATEHKPSHGLLWYINASKLTKIDRFVIPFNKTKFAMQLKRAAFIMGAVKKPEQIAPEGKINGGGECQTCPHSVRCLGYAAWVPKGERALKSRDKARVSKLVDSIAKAKDQSEAAQQSVRETEAKLKATLNELGTKSADLGKVKIQWFRTEGSETLDTAKMKKVLEREGYNLKDFKKKSKPSDKLKITN